MKRKYKIAAGVFTALSLVSIVAEYFLEKNKIESAVSIIGGADGPTAIYVAGTSGDIKFLSMAAVIFLAAAAALLILSRKKK